MTDKVTSLEDFKLKSGRWISGPAICMACRHEWIACLPTGTFEFECPECGAFKGVGKTFLGSEDDCFKCDCGSFLFTIRRIKGKEPDLMCVGCGVAAEGWQ